MPGPASPRPPGAALLTAELRNPPEHSPLLEWFPRLEEIADKVVFGSDWPGPGVPGIREEIEGFQSLPLSERTRERILRTNAVDLIK